MSDASPAASSSSSSTVSKGDLLKDGYAKFNAIEKDFGDGDQSCKATLTATSSGESTTYNGSTGKGHGHAEINALYQFLASIKWNPDRLSEYALTIECLSKPCCVRCSAVMGHLNISATPNTFKTQKPMGKTGYDLAPDIRSFLMKKLKVSQTKISVEICGNAT